MGQQFYLSLYDASQNRYFNKHFFLSKLGEIASNEYWYWGYIKNRPLGIGFIGDQNERFHRDADGVGDGKYDYGVACPSLLFESDCAGELTFGEELLPFAWSGYLVNHTRKQFFSVSDYYERSSIGAYCLDPLALLTASNGCASLFWDGFTDGSAYSLLGYWFADVVEWTGDKPVDMNEICDLEFCEPYFKTMYEAWGLTPEDCLSDKYGNTLFTRKNLGLLHTRIIPAKEKYQFRKDDKGYEMSSDFEPDDGVLLSYEGDKVAFMNPDGSAFTKFQKAWYGTAGMKAADGVKVPFAEWAAERQ